MVAAADYVKQIGVLNMQQTLPFPVNYGRKSIGSIMQSSQWQITTWTNPKRLHNYGE